MEYLFTLFYVLSGYWFMVWLINWMDKLYSDLGESLDLTPKEAMAGLVVWPFMLIYVVFWWNYCKWRANK